MPTKFSISALSGNLWKSSLHIGFHSSFACSVVNRIFRCNIASLSVTMWIDMIRSSPIWWRIYFLSSAAYTIVFWYSLFLPELNAFLQVDDIFFLTRTNWVHGDQGNQPDIQDEQQRRRSRNIFKLTMEEEDLGNDYSHEIRLEISPSTGFPILHAW